MRTPSSGQEVSGKSAPGGGGVTQALLMRQGEGLRESCCVGEPGLHLLWEEMQPLDQFGLCRERRVCNQRQRGSEPQVGQPAHSRAPQHPILLPLVKLAEDGV